MKRASIASTRNNYFLKSKGKHRQMLA